MTVTKKYCPYCGNLYQRYNNHDKEWTVKSQGCPIVSCPNCFKSFIDKDIKEPAFSDAPPKKVNIFNLLVAPLFPFGIGGVFFLFLSLKCDDNGLRTAGLIFSLISLALYAYLIYIGIKNKDEISDDMMKSYKESKRRLSNKNYVIQLLDLGYHVPTLFLEKNYPDLLEYKPKNQKGADK